ncbi:MAG: hypothetical protein HYV90_00820 [Candidatus Woesebacteria bacterium]|nr:MAG: hypothetical protein HYV90_00820 [Candidatus Woesebacteria bacterium]
MGSFNRDDRQGGGFRGGFRGGRSSFGGPRSFDRGGNRGDRPMFKTTCSNCGKECEVPFRPTNGKPVYCSDCFEKMGNRSQGGDTRRPSAPAFDQNKATLDAINVKLDKILSLLQPKTATQVVSEPVIKTEVKEEVKPASVENSSEAKEEKVVKAPKAKKTVKKSASIKK